MSKKNYVEGVPSRTYSSRALHCNKTKSAKELVPINHFKAEKLRDEMELKKLEKGEWLYD